MPIYPKFTLIYNVTVDPWKVDAGELYRPAHEARIRWKTEAKPRQIHPTASSRLNLNLVDSSSGLSFPLPCAAA
jgi:hypothetical protein